jgi:hypothetical protein
MGRTLDRRDPHFFRSYNPHFFDKCRRYFRLISDGIFRLKVLVERPKQGVVGCQSEAISGSVWNRGLYRARIRGGSDVRKGGLEGKGGFRIVEGEVV